MTAIWEAMLAEPRWFAITGLVLDAVCAVLVAFTAWLRVEMSNRYLNGDERDRRSGPDAGW